MSILRSRIYRKGLWRADRWARRQLRRIARARRRCGVPASQLPRVGKRLRRVFRGGGRHD
jgi:hypothetical protein